MCDRWSGGPVGVGKRMNLAYTRAMVHAALSGQLDRAPASHDPIFGLAVPKSVPDVPTEILVPRNTWKDKDAYDARAKDLAVRFKRNFEKFGSLPEAIKAAGPKA